MKKLITLLLVLTGMVSTASATDIYLLGDAPLGGWTLSNSIKMTDNGDGTYYHEFDATSSGTINFCFADVLASKWNDYDDGEGLAFNANSYRPYTYENPYYITLYSVCSEVQSKGTGNSNSSFQMTISDGKKYGIIFDLTNMQVIAYEASENIYVIGTLDDNSWSYNSGITMEKQTKPYIFSVIVEAKGTNNDNNDTHNSYFSFTTSYADSWANLHQYRFGGDTSNPSDNFVVTSDMYTNGTQLQLQYWSDQTRSFQIPLGLYKLSVNKSISKLTINKVETVTTNSSGYCTYVNTNPLTITGATAYYATDNGNGSATAVKMTNPAASTPMLIAGENSTTYYFAVAATGADDPGSSNAFQEGDGTAPGSGNDTDGYNYILNNDAFYLAADRTVPSTKAYLHLSQKAAARALIFDDEATGINAIVNEETTDQYYYNLSGLRIVSPAKGLYIRDGKKVIVK